MNRKYITYNHSATTTMILMKGGVSGRARALRMTRDQRSGCSARCSSLLGPSRGSHNNTPIYWYTDMNI